jgi:pimeloyl-ACP methyl ester carboxylesterase
MSLTTLYLPGTLCDARVWAHLGPLAADEDAHFVDLTRDDSIAGMAARALADAPAQFVLIGFSMGGIVALEIMRRAPDRVAGLALISTNARPDAVPDRADTVARALEGDLSGVLGELIPVCVGTGSDPHVAATVIAMGLELGPEVFRRQSTALAGRIDSRPFLSSITEPTTIIVGNGDQLSPLDRSLEMAAAIPGSAMSVIDDCGHMAPLERPSQLASRLRQWLKHVDRCL